MSPYLTGPEQPERDFIATLKSLGFKKPPFGGLYPRSTYIKGDVWVGVLDTHAGIFGWGRGWQPFATVLELLRQDFGLQGQD